jgi:ubiquitin C-terminal hydrolase
MTNGELIDKATKAKAVLENPAYTDAYTAVKARMVEMLLSVKLQDTATAEDFRRCIFLLDALKAELDAVVSRGKIAAADMNELEKRRNNPLRSIFC